MDVNDKIRYAIGIYDKDEYREYIHKGLEDGRCSVDELIDIIIDLIEEKHCLHKQHMGLVDAINSYGTKESII